LHTGECFVGELEHLPAPGLVGFQEHDAIDLHCHQQPSAAVVLEAVWLLAGHDDMEAGRRIRRYTITDAGRLALAEARHALRELVGEFLQWPARSRTMPRWVTLHYRVVVVEAQYQAVRTERDRFAAQVEQLRRAGRRQAAPFSKDRPMIDPPRWHASGTHGEVAVECRVVTGSRG
jgi:DNA-binding PadR family transcriptional regulator